VWVVVTMLGVPDQVVVYDSSNDPEVDERAVEYIKNLRWLPNGKRRTGSMTVEWKEGQS
jgi:outer membrane biosynthesis protein TonB